MFNILEQSPVMISLVSMACLYMHGVYVHVYAWCVFVCMPGVLVHVFLCCICVCMPGVSVVACSVCVCMPGVPVHVFL